VKRVFIPSAQLVTTKLQNAKSGKIQNYNIVHSILTLLIET